MNYTIAYYSICAYESQDKYSLLSSFTAELAIFAFRYQEFHPPVYEAQTISFLSETNYTQKYESPLNRERLEFGWAK